MSRPSSLAAPFRLSCDARTDPIGLGNTTPELRWKIPPGGVARVTAYEIHAASSLPSLRSGKADLWRTGPVACDWANSAEYGGHALSSRAKVWWRVRVWGEAGKPSAWSAAASWEIGLLAAEDWQASWIAAPVYGSRHARAPAPYFRRTFEVKGNPRSARLHVTARGLYEGWLGGKPVTVDTLVPGWTDYAHRIPVRCYDVTDLINPGPNVLGLVLGDGWYSGRLAWQDRQNYGDRPSLLAQLEVEMADGSRQVVASDGDWMTRTGPILENDLISGESYDARLDLGAWSEPDYAEVGWQNCEVEAPPSARLESARGLPVRPQEILDPVSRVPADPELPGDERDAFIFDLGQNFAGRIRVRLKGRRGAGVRFRYAEMLAAPDRVYVENLRSAEATDYYTLGGAVDGEAWEPRFTFHGFRYVEVTVPRGAVTIEALQGVVLHNDLAEAGRFKCSHPLINQLHSNIRWGQTSNFLEAPTDCPQRDERLGWTGDAQVFVRTATFNGDVEVFFGKWAQDLRDAQGADGRVPAVAPGLRRFAEDGGPAWSDAHIICPWTVYQAYGDKRILSDHYDSMRRYLRQLIDRRSHHYIRSHPVVDGFAGYGDWLAIDGSLDRFGNTPKDLIGTAFLAHDAGLMAKIAHLLVRPSHAREYATIRKRVVKAFNRRFVTPEGQVLGGTQTAYVLALHFDLLPESLRPAAVEALVRDIESRGFHLSTGFVGTPYICHVLTRFGQLGVAYRLLEQQSFPSWLLPVVNGATTMWERWNSWTPEEGFGDVSMNSFNHYAYGAVGDWLYSTVAGLDGDEAGPGYRRIRFRPHPGGSLTQASATLVSPRGRIAIDWKMVRGDLKLKIVVPPNTEATLEVPPGWKFPTPAIRGQLPARVTASQSESVWQIAPGTHRISLPRAEMT